MSETRANRAFLIGVKGDSRFDCVVSAYTMGKAVARCHRLSDDAGYRFQFKDFVKRRAPEYDTWAAQFTGVQVTGKDHVDRWLSALSPGAEDGK